MSETLEMKKIKKTVVLLAIASIVIGASAGFGLGYAFMQPRIQALELSASQLNKVMISGLLSAGLSSYSHGVSGWVANFGINTADNVKLTITWALSGGGTQVEVVQLGKMLGRTVKPVAETFSFATKADSFSWAIAYE